MALSVRSSYKRRRYPVGRGPVAAVAETRNYVGELLKTKQSSARAAANCNQKQKVRIKQTLKQTFIEVLALPWILLFKVLENVHYNRINYRLI